MPLRSEDDLFRDSTMTFGQHLGELRDCLIKSALGLAVGFVIGLSVGNYVVAFIRSPLSNALERYYQTEAATKAEERTGAAEDVVQRRVFNENLLGDEYFIDPVEMLEQLKTVYPEQFKGVQLPAKGAEKEPEASSGADANETGMIRLFLWHRSADDPRLKVKTFNAQEAFSVWVKASLLVGVLLASPWIFYQIWHFVAAGLYPHERQYVHMYLPFSLGLFLAGAGLAFFVVFEPVLNFLFSFNRSLGIDPDPRINEWLSFVLWLPLGFGIGFQLPLVLLFLERIGVFTVKSYIAQWRVAVLVIFVTAALLTPPDPYSMLLMAVPLTVLYFGGIALCKFLPRRSSSYGEIAQK